MTFLPFSSSFASIFSAVAMASRTYQRRTGLGAGAYASFRILSRFFSKYSALRPEYCARCASSCR